MKLDNNLSSQMIEYMPFGVYIIDREYKISYYNQAFAEIFSPGVHPTSVYFGVLAGCQYCIGKGEPDQNNTQCSNCLIIRQHDTAFDNKAMTSPQEVVQEFEINGKRILKFVKLQSIPLNDNQLMVIIHDITQEAEKMMNPPS